MQNNPSIMNWSTLHHLPVNIFGQGVTVGTVEDFYFKPDTNAVYALCVRLRLLGDRSLPVTGIRSIGPSGILIPSAEMLLQRLPPLPTGESLANTKIISESGRDLGMVKEIVLGIEPVVTMRIAGFEMLKPNGRQTQTVGADAVGRYNDGTVVLTDSAAKLFR